MRKVAIVGLALCLSGCSLWNKITSPSRAQSNQTAVVVGSLQADFRDKASGNNAAIERAANDLPPSQPKTVILEFVSDQYSLLGQPKPETKATFVQAAEELLSLDATKRVAGETLRQKLSTENESLKQTLAAEEEKFKQERLQEDAAHKAQIDKIRLENEAAQKKFVSWLFFGGSFLFLAAGVVVLTMMSSVPQFGPKIGFGLLAASGVSAGTGIGILQLMSHPEVVWWGLGVIGAIVLVVISLMYANHKHHVDGK